MLTEYSAAGVAITDEVVSCTEEYTAGGVTYYRGWLANSCNENIQGADSATYGVWTEAAKGGSRKTVYIAGYPANTSSVSIDLAVGAVYAKESCTLYVRYLAHEPLFLSALGRAVLTQLLVSGAVTLGGTVIMSDLPTSDPGVAGQLWSDSGAVKVSAGI